MWRYVMAGIFLVLASQSVREGSLRVKRGGGLESRKGRGKKERGAICCIGHENCNSKPLPHHSQTYETGVHQKQTTGGVNQGTFSL